MGLPALDYLAPRKQTIGDIAEKANQMLIRQGRSRLTKLVNHI